MAIHRYGVLDKNGVLLNIINVSDELLQTDWWPGYGADLIDLGVIPQVPRSPLPPAKPADFSLIDVVPSQPMQIGDRIDIQTGIVTPAPPAVAIDEVVIDAP